MLFSPNAKINLGLAVMRKRTDGYHDLETIFLPVRQLCDELTVEPLAPEAAPDAGYTFSQEGIAVDCPPEQNLIIRTYLTMRERYAHIGPVSIRFRKNIPFGAGLGGGSADAAFMAKALNELFALGLTDEQLEAEVSPMGADCAFFIKNRPQYAEGIGNIFSPVPEEIIRQIEGRWLVLLKPECAVSTGQAYRGIRRRDEDGREGIKGLTDLRLLTNDFELTVFPLFPEIAAIKEALLARGAFYAAMSGSGATVFGLFREQQHDLSEAFPGCFVHQEQM